MPIPFSTTFGTLPEENFEQELKSVIFSHIPDAQRLGHKTFDKLLQYKTEEKQKRIDSLIRKLRELSRQRSSLEAENNPVFRQNIKEQIKRKERELKANKEAKPKEVANPATKTGIAEPKSASLEALKKQEESGENLVLKIENAQDILKKEERRLAAATRLLETLSNFEKDFHAFKDSLKTDIEVIGIEVDDLLLLTIKKDPIIKIRDNILGIINTAKKLLGDEQTPGLLRKLETVKNNIQKLQLQLDAPNRIYQAYLKEVEEYCTIKYLVN